MDSKFNQEDTVRCRLHPQRPICFIYCKQNCPYPSRLACNQCVLIYRSLEGFEEVPDVLKDPRVILNARDRSEYGTYDLLNKYFDLLTQDPEEFIQSFKMGILEQIQLLEKELKEGIEKYKQFRSEIAKVRIQFNQALGQEQFSQIFREILRIEDYHYELHWNKLEETVQQYIQQFKVQDNQELKEAYSRLKQMEQNFFKPQYLSDFQLKCQKGVEKLSIQLLNLGVFADCSKLCDPLYFYELIQRISKNQKIVTRIFKGSEDGMNSHAFSQKCCDQGSTILICKSKHGHVFGGYNPYSWNSNGKWQKDEDKLSFLFSYTRKEVYPIVSGEQAVNFSVYFGLKFGRNEILKIANDFQGGSSNFSDKSQYQCDRQRIDNPSTYLMGGQRPELVEMEVFQIK